MASLLRLAIGKTRLAVEAACTPCHRSLVEDAGLRDADPTVREAGFQEGHGMALDAAIATVQQLVHDGPITTPATQRSV